jgi:hypothetical protein
MLRARLIAAVLAGSLGSVLAGPVVQAHDYGHHERWEGRAYDRHEWAHRAWDRHYVDHVGRRRYWDGHAWVFMLPPPPHIGWHWDITLGRYCP